MGKNTGNGGRIGVVKNRSQCFNPNTNQYIKRDKETGQFIASKDTPFKGVRNETKKSGSS